MKAWAEAEQLSGGRRHDASNMLGVHCILGQRRGGRDSHDGTAALVCESDSRNSGITHVCLREKERKSKEEKYFSPSFLSLVMRTPISWTKWCLYTIVRPWLSVMQEGIRRNARKISWCRRRRGQTPRRQAQTTRRGLFMALTMAPADRRKKPAVFTVASLSSYLQEDLSQTEQIKTLSRSWSEPRSCC